MATDGHPKTVCLMGHSFIRRLAHYMEEAQNENLRLDKNLYTVYTKHAGGLTMIRMARCRLFSEFQAAPDICYIQIGKNDLDRLEVNSEGDGSTVSRLVGHIVSWVRYLLTGIGVRRVMVGQLFRRQPWAIKSEPYDRDMINTNIKLEQELRSIDGAYFWHHRGFWESRAFLARDGVHIRCTRLDTRYMRKYLQSVKSAVLFASRH